MTTTVKAVVKLPHVSLLPLDADENTFVFDGEQVTGLDLANDLIATNVFARFYSSMNTSHELSAWMSSVLSRVAAACTVEFFDITGHLDGSAAGPPVQTSTFTLAAALTETIGLPAEVACVATMFGSGRAAAPVQGSTVATIPTDRRARAEGAPALHSGRPRPKQSHTGRLYIGPLDTAVMTLATGEARFLPGFIADLKVAMTRLRTDVLGIGVPTTWDVWSRRLGIVDAIVGGYIDDAPDTQRRRGVERSTRVLWP